MSKRAQQLTMAEQLYRPLVEQIFQHWQTILNHPRSILDVQKFKVIVTQLELGHTPENLMLAIEGVAVDPWEGRRQHDALDVIFRSNNIDRFMSLGEEAKEWAARQQEKAEKAMAMREESKAINPMPSNVNEYLTKFRARMVAR